MAQLTYELLDKDVLPGTFDCGNASINEWVVNSYYVTLLQHGYAYRICAGETVLGYYMIMLRNIELAECPESISEFYEETLCTKIPSVCIKYIAIAETFQKQGIGTVILRSLISLIRKWTDTFPIRVITIDAETYLVDWYKREGFREMPNNSPGQEGVTVYMYMDCIKNPKKLAEYTQVENL